MSAPRVARVGLWAWGLAAWIVIAWVVEKLIPEKSGPFAERPVGVAILVGAVFGLSTMIVDLIRAPHRRWLWGLTAWGVVLSLNVLAGINDSDLDQWIGWGVGLGGIAGLPLIVPDVRAAAKRLDRISKSERLVTRSS
jgi:hypothetical protein